MFSIFILKLTRLVEKFEHFDQIFLEKRKNEFLKFGIKIHVKKMFKNRLGSLIALC